MLFRTSGNSGGGTRETIRITKSHHYTIMKPIHTLLFAAAALLGAATLPLAGADEHAATCTPARLTDELARAVDTIAVLSVPDALARLREHGQALEDPKRGASREAMLATLDRWAEQYAADPQGFVRGFDMTDIFDEVQLTDPDELAPLIAALIREGASLEVEPWPSGAVTTPLMTAAWHHAYRCAQLFLASGVPVNARSEDRFDTALACAVAANDARMMMLLLAHGASPDKRNDWDENLLMLAADFNAVDAARLLLQRGADVDEESYNHWTPLAAAAHRGRAEMVAFLLDHGAAVEGSPEGGVIPLVLCASACWYDFEDCARLLLDHGANVNATDSSGNTALIHAARNRSGSASFVRLLLERGADVHLRNKAGETALTPIGERAARTIELLPEPKPEVKKLLLQYGAK